MSPLLRCAVAAFLVIVPLTSGCAPSSATSRARSLARQHHEREAIDSLERRLGDQPNDIEARRLLIRLLGWAGELPAARAQVDELARRLAPGDPVPSIELGHALELNHLYDEALEAYDHAAALAPSSPEGPREGGLRSARWGELEQARARLEEAVRRGAHDVETWHTLGLVRLNLEDYDGALDAYRAGAVVEPKDAECWLGLATVGLVRGDAQLTLDAYDRVITLTPRFASAYLGRAWALAQLGRDVEANRAIDRAEELGAPTGAVARQRAVLSGSAGRTRPGTTPP